MTYINGHGIFGENLWKKRREERVRCADVVLCNVSRQEYKI